VRVPEKENQSKGTQQTLAIVIQGNLSDIVIRIIKSESAY
jgi:hypothetical protein